MRVLIVNDCVPRSQVETMAPGVVTACEDSFSAALAIIRARACDVVIVPESIGEASSVTCLDAAQVSRAYGVACVIVTDVWDDGSYGAAAMSADGDVRAAVLRALTFRMPA